MAKSNRLVPAGKNAVVSSKTVSKAAAPKGRSLTTAARGVKTSEDFAEMMSGLMTDLRDGSVSPQIGNAVCNAGGKLLKVVEMQHKYGQQGATRVATPKPLTLSA